MANFEIVRNQLEGIVNTQLNATRQTQGVWEWFNALYRITSANKNSGTVYIYGPASVNDADPGDEDITAVTVRILPDEGFDRLQASKYAYAAPELLVDPLAPPPMPLCPVCKQGVSLGDRGFVKVHFTSVLDKRPCLGSFCDLAGKHA